MKKSLILSFMIPLLTALAGGLLFIAWKADPFLRTGNAAPPPEMSGDAVPLPEGPEDLAKSGYQARLLAVTEEADPILESYRHEETKERVVDFFAGITHSRPVARSILENAAAFNVSPALAFALCWEESRYNPWAVGRRNLNRSVDRGLFQLNSGSFTKLHERDFFDPEVNAYYGVSHLRWCLDNGGSDVAALAIYNAGNGRVNAGGTPRKTLDYISRILKLRAGIDSLFRAEADSLGLIAQEEDQFPEEGGLKSFLRALF